MLSAEFRGKASVVVHVWDRDYFVRESKRAETFATVIFYQGWIDCKEIARVSFYRQKCFNNTSYDSMFRELLQKAGVKSTIAAHGY